MPPPKNETSDEEEDGEEGEVDEEEAGEDGADVRGILRQTVQRKKTHLAASLEVGCL